MSSKKIKASSELWFKISQDSYLNVILFSDDMIVILNEECALQESGFKRRQICKQHNRKISTMTTLVDNMSTQGSNKIKNNN